MRANPVLAEHRHGTALSARRLRPPDAVRFSPIHREGRDPHDPVKRLKVDRVINGSPRGMALVMDFDSADAVTELFDSDDYAALIPVRDRGFSEMNILLTQEM